VVELSCNEIQRLFAAAVEVCVGETAPVALVAVTMQHQARARVGSLPAPAHPATMKITISGWSIRGWPNPAIVPRP
jgi:hypothetical protein